MLLCVASKLSHFQVTINNLGSGEGEKTGQNLISRHLRYQLLGSSRAEFINLNSIDILGWIIFCCEEPPVHSRMLAASLALAY